MTKHPFKAFIDLIHFDQTIRELHQAIASLQKQAHAIAQQQKDRAEQSVHIHEQAKQLRMQVDAQELEMKALDEQEKQKIKQLEATTDSRAYESLEKEIKHLKSLQHDAEKILLGLWNKLELAQKESASLTKQDATDLADLKAKHEHVQQQIEAKQKECATLEQERPSKKEHVPDEWLEQYESMRLRVSDPVVPDLDGSCSACFGAITSQDQVRLKRRALLLCKSCFRLLYHEAAMEQPLNESNETVE